MFSFYFIVFENKGRIGDAGFLRKRKGNKGWGSFVQTLILITYALDGVKEDLSSGGSKPSDNGGRGGGEAVIQTLR